MPEVTYEIWQDEKKVLLSWPHPYTLLTTPSLDITLCAEINIILSTIPLMKSTKVQNPRRKHAFGVLLYARKVAGVMSHLHAPRSKC